MAHGIGAIKAGGLAPFAERFCVDGFAAARLASPVRGLRLLAVALADRLGSIFGRPPRYLPGAGRPGELAIGATADALFGERLMTPKDGTEWRNRVAARSLLSFSWRRPVRRAAAIRCPILLVVAERDTLAPVSHSGQAPVLPPGRRLHGFPGDSRSIIRHPQRQDS